jgi:hypothetical protein
MRSFIEGILRDMEGNALLSLATGRTEPTKAAPHGKLKIEEHHWFSYPAEIDLMVEFAERAYADGRDAYLSPVIYGPEPYRDKKGNAILRDYRQRPLFSRSKTNALFTQTIYMDSDACPPEAFRIPPSRHVNTSEGHGHDYWYLAHPIPAPVAAEIAHRITTAHKKDGSDPSGWSQNKILRLPTFNTSYDEVSPYPVTWGESPEAQGGEVYLADDISGAYDDVVVDAVPEDANHDLAPVPALEGLPDFEDLVSRIPESETRLNDLIYKIPKAGPDGWRSEQRYALLLDLQRFGFTDEETVALAWHSPAASKWREDARGVEGLWWELQVRVKPVLAQERGDDVPPAPVALPRPSGGPKLLTPTKRLAVEGRHDLLTLYLNYAVSRVQTPNMPYHVINGWTLISLGLSEAVELPKDPRALGTGIFSITLGKSSSGKDESKSILTSFVRELYPSDDPDIPVSSSREMLIENLIARTDKVTYLQDNEFDGTLSTIKQGGYSTGIVQYWTRAYDGEVPSLGRVGKQELNKPGTHAIPVMHFMGTPEGILSVVDKSMFHTGYLARQIWVIGEDIETTQESMRSKFRRDEEGGNSFDAIPKYMGSHFANLRAKLRSGTSFNRKRAWLEPTDEAIEMLDQAKWKIHQFVARDHDVEMWKPILRRLGDILWKIAGLSAASNGRTVIGTLDVEVALYYAEGWIANVMEVADRVSDTHFSKQCDDIEKFIAAREGMEAELGAIYRFRRGEPRRVTDEFLDSLVSQGRVSEKQPKPGSPRYYKIKEKK